MNDTLNWSNCVLDSDILIDYLRGYQPTLDFINALFSQGVRIYFSVISEAEIYANVRSGEAIAVRMLFDSLYRVAVNGAIARKAGSYRAQYDRSHSLMLPDALIAATAFEVEAELFSRNIRHYPMTDVKVVAPYVLAHY